jgi:hypothetical protein
LPKEPEIRSAIDRAIARQVDEKNYAGPEHLDPDYVAKYDSKARTDPAPTHSTSKISD